MQHARLAFIAAGLVAFTACDADEPTTAAPETVAAFAKGGINAEMFRTSAPAQAEILVPGEVVPLATAGDVMPGSGERLGGTPDGIGSFGNGRYMQAYVNHEFSVSGTFGGAKVSRLVLDTETGYLLNHEYVVDGSENFNRLCSASWSDADDGFPGGYFFTGEEFSDGLQLAIDAQGRVTEMPHLGYYAHEQQISVPGFKNQVVLVNFDDSGTGGGDATTEDGSSELYMYVASNANAALRGVGQLYVFASDEAGDVGDLSQGDVITGRWIPVPESIATNPDGQVLEDFVDQPATDAFDFTRLEDGFYDKVSAANGENPAMYFYDTGDPTLGSGGVSWDRWGAIYRMEWEDPADPAGTVHLSLLARSAGPGSGWASPDNGDMNADGVIMLQEDPAASGWTRPETQIWAFQRAADGSLVDPAGSLVAQTVGSNCVSGSCWETSGIEDVSRWFGPNAWIFDVQAKGNGVSNITPPCPECRSNGQVLLMKIGGEFAFD